MKVDYKEFQLPGFEFMHEARERTWYTRWVLRLFGFLPLAPLDQNRPGRFNEGPMSGEEFCERLSIGMGFSDQEIVRLARYHGRRIEDRGELVQVGVFFL